jgi:hypothetical protein
MFAVIKRGGIVALFPAGQSSLSGEATYINKNVARLIKKMSVPVKSVRINGAHIAQPKWDRSGIRPSKIQTSVELLFTADELKDLDCEQIYERIVDALYFDDYEWQKQMRVAAKKPRSAKGLERILLLCPSCEVEFSIQVRGSDISCTACGFQTSMDEYGFLTSGRADEGLPSTPTQWYRWQFAQYEDVVNDDLIYREKVKLYHINAKNECEYFCDGEATLTKNKFSFCADTDGADEHAAFSLTIDNALSPAFPHERLTSFDVMYDKQLYAVEPENERAVFKFLILKEIIFRKYFA